MRPADWIALGLYLVFILGVGAWMTWRQRGASDRFLAGRSMTWDKIGLSIFSTNISPTFLIASCGIAYSSGMGAASFEWLAIFGLFLLAEVFAPRYLADGITTIPEYLRDRFGDGPYTVLSFYTLVSTVFLWLGAALYAGAVLLSQVLGWPLEWCCLLMAGLAAAFTVGGGLALIMVTDSLQSIIIIAGSLLISFFAFREFDGWGHFFSTVPSGHWNVLRPAGDASFPWPAVFLGYPVLAVWFWCTDQTIVQRVLGARDLREARKGCQLAAVLKILPPFLFMLPGLLILGLRPGLENPDEAFSILVLEYLPAGLTGIMLAVLVAASVSTLDGGLNAFSTVSTFDIYRRWIRPGADAAHLDRVRIGVTLGAAALSVAMALWMHGTGRSFFDLINGILSFIAPPLAAVFLLAVFWPRINGRGVMVGLLGGGLLSLGTGVAYFAVWPGAGFWPHYLYLCFLLFLLCLALAVMVSLTAPPAPAPRAHRPAVPLERGPVGRASWGGIAVVIALLYTGFWLLGRM